MTGHLSEVLTGNEKLSEAIREKWKDPEYREKQIKARTGKHYPKRSEALKGNTHGFKKGQTPWIKARAWDSDYIDGRRLDGGWRYHQ